MTRRWRLAWLAALLLALGASGVLAARAGLASCGPLDRLFGRSGCLARFPLPGYAPMLWETMVLPPGGGGDPVASLFGQVVTVDGPRMALLRLNLRDGHESGRIPLPIREAEILAIAADRDRVSLSCPIRRDACTEAGGAMLVVAARDGTPLDQPAVRDLYRFPGEPAPVGLARGSVRLPGDGPEGALAIEPRMGEGRILVRRLADGAALRALEQAPPGALRHVGFALFPSPSGRLVAALDTSPPPAQGHGAIIHVWEVASGRLVARRGTDPGHGLQRALVWLPDEARVAVLQRGSRDGARDASLQIFSVAPPG